MAAISTPTLVAVPETTLKLKCPCCRTALAETSCIHCGFELIQERGVWSALPITRAQYFAQFVEEYGLIRASEGRGSGADDFYLALPYCDLSERNQAQWSIRARSFDYLIRSVLQPTLNSRGKRVLDIGAGNCWMSYRLAKIGYKPAAVDLNTSPTDGLQAAEHYRGYLEEFFPRFRAEMQNLPFEDEQFDAIVFNASFHYAEDYEAALAEALRCVRPGGLVVICDSPWYACEASGAKMVAEKHATFQIQYGTASNSIRSQEFLTEKRLTTLERSLRIRWTVHKPYYGFRWALRPFIAKVRGRREPSRFRIYVTQKTA